MPIESLLLFESLSANEMRMFHCRKGRNVVFVFSCTGLDVECDGTSGKSSGDGTSATEIVAAVHQQTKNRQASALLAHSLAIPQEGAGKPF